MSQVVFVEPPAELGPGGKSRAPERIYGCSYELYHFPDLANLYGASALLDAGFEVGIVDGVLEGLTHASFLERIRNADAVAFIFHSVLLSKDTDLATLQEIRRVHPKALVIFHGPEPTRDPSSFLLDDRVSVLRGEADLSLKALLRTETAPGLSRMVQGRIEQIPIDRDVLQLDALPFPARDHPDLRPFRQRLHNPKFKSGPSTTLMASLGCAFRCLFCVPNAISFARELEHVRSFGKKPKVAMASAQRVIQEFQLIRAQGFRSVSVIDDQFLWDKPRTLEICQGVRDLGLEWGILSRPDFLQDVEVVRALREAGCTSVDIGAESLSQRDLDFVQKDVTVSQIETALRNCQANGLVPKLNILLGACPTQSVQDVRKTVSHLRRMKIDRVMFSIATPFPGTNFEAFCQAQGYLKNPTESLDPMHKSMVSFPAPGMKRSELEQEARRAYRAFYLHPSTLWRKARSIRSLSELVHNLKIAGRLFG